MTNPWTRAKQTVEQLFQNDPQKMIASANKYVTPSGNQVFRFVLNDEMYIGRVKRMFARHGITLAEYKRRDVNESNIKPKDAAEKNRMMLANKAANPPILQISLAEVNGLPDDAKAWFNNMCNSIKSQNQTPISVQQAWRSKTVQI